MPRSTGMPCPIQSKRKWKGMPTMTTAAPNKNAIRRICSISPTALPPTNRRRYLPINPFIFMLQI